MKTPLPTPSTDVTPPAAPWKEISRKPRAQGALSYYYNDELAKLPVRAVTKPQDNKADPNLETLSYGLFSTCQKGLRSAFVKNGRQHLFFITACRGVRVLTGYYSVKWYAPLPAAGPGDFALAADEAYFLGKPLPLADVDAACGTDINHWFRTSLLLEEEECQRILTLMHRQPDAKEAYLQELDRLERFNKSRGGFRYIGRQSDASFSWSIAAPFLLQKPVTTDSPQVAANNSSLSGWWTCEECGEDVFNKALLRACPGCSKVGTLKARTTAPESTTQSDND
jgi:hypothetical protein